LKKSSIFSRTSAVFLLLIILLSTTGRLLHLLDDAHAHAELRVCSVDDNDGKTHLHDAHFLTEDCQLCHFVVQSSVLPDLRFFILPVQQPIVQAAIAAPAIPFLVVELTANLLRGPPRAIA
jgi:hypothetical protein